MLTNILPTNSLTKLTMTTAELNDFIKNSIVLNDKGFMLRFRNEDFQDSAETLITLAYGDACRITENYYYFPILNFLPQPLCQKNIFTSDDSTSKGSDLINVDIILPFCIARGEILERILDSTYSHVYGEFSSYGKVYKDIFDNLKDHFSNRDKMYEEDKDVTDFYKSNVDILIFTRKGWFNIFHRDKLNFIKPDQEDIDNASLSYINYSNLFLKDPLFLGCNTEINDGSASKILSNHYQSTIIHITNELKYAVTFLLSQIFPNHKGDHIFYGPNKEQFFNKEENEDALWYTNWIQDYTDKDKDNIVLYEKINKACFKVIELFYKQLNVDKNSFFSYRFYPCINEPITIKEIKLKQHFTIINMVYPRTSYNSRHLKLVESRTYNQDNKSSPKKHIKTCTPYTNGLESMYRSFYGNLYVVAHYTVIASFLKRKVSENCLTCSHNDTCPLNIWLSLTDTTIFRNKNNQTLKNSAREENGVFGQFFTNHRFNQVGPLGNLVSTVKKGNSLSIKHDYVKDFDTAFKEISSWYPNDSIFCNFNVQNKNKVFALWDQKRIMYITKQMCDYLEDEINRIDRRVSDIDRDEFESDKNSISTIKNEIKSYAFLPSFYDMGIFFAGICMHSLFYIIKSYMLHELANNENYEDDSKSYFQNFKDKLLINTNNASFQCVTANKVNMLIPKMFLKPQFTGEYFATILTASPPDKYVSTFKSDMFVYKLYFKVKNLIYMVHQHSEKDIKEHENKHFGKSIATNVHVANNKSVALLEKQAFLKYKSLELTHTLNNEEIDRTFSICFKKSLVKRTQLKNNLDSIDMMCRNIGSRGTEFKTLLKSFCTIFSYRAYDLELFKRYDQYNFLNFYEPNLKEKDGEVEYISTFDESILQNHSCVYSVPIGINAFSCSISNTKINFKELSCKKLFDDLVKNCGDIVKYHEITGVPIFVFKYKYIGYDRGLFGNNTKDSSDFLTCLLKGLEALPPSEQFRELVNNKSDILDSMLQHTIQNDLLDKLDILEKVKLVDNAIQSINNYLSQWHDDLYLLLSHYSDSDSLGLEVERRRELERSLEKLYEISSDGESDEELDNRKQIDICSTDIPETNDASNAPDELCELDYENVGLKTKRKIHESESDSKKQKIECFNEAEKYFDDLKS